MLGQIDGNHTSTQLGLSHGVGREGEKGVGVKRESRRLGVYQGSLWEQKNALIHD